MNIKVLKTHGSGNDFILINIQNNQKINDLIKPKLAIKLCQRKKSIGADGILFIEKSKKGDGLMRIFNSDGSEAEMCGNGIRIVGRYLIEKLNKDTVFIENATGKLYEITKVNFIENTTAYKVNFPKAALNISLFPIKNTEGEIINDYIKEISDEIKFTAISMPNPHLVTKTGNMTNENLNYWGLKLNNSIDLIPNGVNLSFINKLDKNNVYVKTFERGVGITNSCGTAMCASIISLTINNEIEFNTTINVLNQGGLVRVIVNKDLSCSLIGNATFVFEANLDINLDKIDEISFFKGKLYIQEIESYNKIIQFSKQLIKKTRA